MNCQLAQEEISALLDGESCGVASAEVYEHLAGCAACRDWQERAHELTRRARLQPSPAPRPTAELLRAVTPERPVPRRRWQSLTAARAGLAVVALGQLALSLPVLLFGHDHSAPVHVAHEMGSFDVAVAVGFLAAVRRPARAMGMLPLMGVAAGLLVLTAAIDLAVGHTDILDEAPHLLVVAGWLLLRRLAVLAPPSRDRPLSPRALAGALRTSLRGVSARVPRSVSIGAEPEGFAPAVPSALESTSGAQLAPKDRREVFGR